MTGAGFRVAAPGGRARDGEPYRANPTYFLGEDEGQPLCLAGTGCPSVSAARLSSAAWQVPATRQVPEDPGREELWRSNLLATHPAVALSTQGLVTYLQGLFGPLFLGIVGIVALFFLFTREITRFVQFIVLAVLIAIVFYTPGIVQALATGITNALGVH